MLIVWLKIDTRPTCHILHVIFYHTVSCVLSCGKIIFSTFAPVVFFPQETVIRNSKLSDYYILLYAQGDSIKGLITDSYELMVYANLSS